MGDSPLLMSEELVKATNAVRQADSGFVGRCLRKFSEAPLRPNSPLPVGPLNLMTFAMGGTPRAGSWHLPLFYFLKQPDVVQSRVSECSAEGS